MHPKAILASLYVLLVASMGFSAEKIEQIRRRRIMRKANMPVLYSFYVSNVMQDDIFKTFRKNIKAYTRGESSLLKSTFIDPSRLLRASTSDPKEALAIEIAEDRLIFSFVRLNSLEKRSGKWIPTFIQYVKKFEPLDEGRELDTYDWEEWVARVIEETLPLKNSEKPLPCALTVYMPIRQTALNKAKISFVPANWPFKTSDALLKTDIVKALDSTFKKYRLNIAINCILENSVATFAAGLITKKDINQMGIVLGSGINCSFITLGEDGSLAFVNSNWAKIIVSSEFITDDDRDVVDELIRNETPYSILDVLTAGEHYVEIIKAALLNMRYFRNRRKIKRAVKCLDYEDLAEIYTEDTSKLIGWEKIVQGVIFRFKSRASKIQAAMILAFAQRNGLNFLRIILNGSVYEDRNDRAMLLYEINAIAKRKRYNLEVKIVYKRSSNLVGAAFVASCYD
ncbi:hypothetical protein ENBRE01_0892 [Enteropsectra breve]|nr:hypothetical protein ENBRE01_0892 [Enteropsectra breve]